MKLYPTLAGLSLLIAITASAQAEDLTADQIVEHANRASYYAGTDGRADVEMIITDSKGGTRERAFTILRKNVGDADQKFYVYFREPADVRKMAFLVWKHVEPGEDDDRWMWLPAMNLVRRIAPGDKRTSFVGSDFFYEDVSGRNLHADTHELIETTDTQYRIKNTPVDAGSVEFSSYEVWVDKDTFLPRKAEYLDKQGQIYRRVEANEVKTIEGHPTVMESVVYDLKTGGHTVNRFTQVTYDLGLKETIFSERFLRRPPREVQAR